MERIDNVVSKVDQMLDTSVNQTKNHANESALLQDSSILNTERNTITNREFGELFEHGKLRRDPESARASGKKG